MFLCNLIGDFLNRCDISKSMRGTLNYLLILIFMLFFGSTGFAQSAQETFGKNRIQYRNFTWKYLSTNSVDLFFYDEGEVLAQHSIEIAEVEFRRISDLFGFTPYNKIKIFLYLSSNDRLMSNLGISNTTSQTGGKTNFTKSITEVAYEGSLIQLKKQISAGIAQILIRDMLFGGSLKDAVQNSYLLTLPDWFIGGAIKFASEGNSPEMEDLLRELAQRKKLRQPANFVGQEAYLVGQSIWSFISEKYGKSSVGNILNLTRIIRNEENAVAGTLGITFHAFTRDWKNFYYLKNNSASLFYSPPPAQNRLGWNLKRKNYKQLTFSADGQFLLYTTDVKGKFQVMLHEVKSGKTHTMFRGGARILQQNSEGEFPLACFTPENRIVIAYPEKGGWKGLSMNLRGRERKSLDIFKDFNEIYGFQVAPDGKSIVISGSLESYADLFLVTLPGFKRIRLTQDEFDDLDPFFNPSGDSLFFSSNRFPRDTNVSPRQILEAKRKYALFKMGIGKEKTTPKLIWAPDGNFLRGQMMGENTVVGISDEGGIPNVVQVNLKESPMIPRFVTTSKYSILDFAVQADHQLLAYTTNPRLKPQLFLDGNLEPASFSFRRSDAQSTDPSDSLSAQKKSMGYLAGDSNRIDIRNYVFEDEKKSTQSASSAKSRKERVKLKRDPKNLVVEIQGPNSYLPNITADHLTTGLVINPIPAWGLGALVDFSMHDLFENHHISGGMTYFFSDLEMRNNWSFLEYQYLKRRIDFKVRAERKSIQSSSNTQFIRQRDILNSLTTTASWPISTALRLDVSPFFQVTRRNLFDQVNLNLGGNDLYKYYFGAAAEMVFDNTITTGINLISGTRIKARVQYQANKTDPDRSFGELSVDARTYQPIHKEITLALRGSFGRFFGNAPKKYSLGGMDNWLFRSYNVSDAKDDPLRGINQSNLTLSSDEAQTDWLFNRFCTNLRGFKYNAAYGTNFMLFNAELRIPIVRYVYKGPIDSNFWRNLQLTAFTDFGTAWTGVGPFNKDNSLNTKQVEEGNFLIKIKSYENPFLMGYGFGARTVFLGYFTKFDMAWGVKNNITSDPAFYFTLGHDF